VDHADTGASQHGDDLFRNFREIDGDAIALLQAKCLEGIGAPVDLTQQFSIGEDAFLAVFTDPDDGDFVAPPGVRVAIQAVISDIAGRADEPFGPGVVPIEHLAPRRKPIQFLGHTAPERFRIGDGSLVSLLIVLNMSSRLGLGGRLNNTSFFQ